MGGAILRGEPQAVFPQLAEHLAANPALAKLFVPVTELALARRQAREPGGVLRVAFETIQKASAKSAAKGR
jgi:hypothetical protein